jgi:hypothetical protein
MIRAKHEQEEKRQMMIELQGRINKMRSEEERTKRHIAEAKRKSNFIASMKEEKARIREEKIKHEIEVANKEKEIKKKALHEKQV